MPNCSDIDRPARNRAAETDAEPLARRGKHFRSTSPQPTAVPAFKGVCAFDWKTAPALTRHAETRLRQRAITVEQVVMVIDFGSEQRAHGASRFFLDKVARHRLAQVQPSAQRDLGSLDIQVVLADDGRLITAAHRTKRIRRDIQRSYRRGDLQKIFSHQSLGRAQAPEIVS